MMVASGVAVLENLPRDACGLLKRELTDEEYDDTGVVLARYAFLVGYPLLLTFCTVGNILVMVTLTRCGLVNSTSIYLTFIAAANICYMWCQMPNYLQTADHEYLENDVTAQQYFDSRGFIHWCRETSVQLSDWTLVCFSVERLAVCVHPLRFGVGLRTRRALQIELVLLLLAMVFNVEYLVTNYYFTANDDGINTMKTIIGPHLYRWNRIQLQLESAVSILKWLLLLTINSVLVKVITNSRYKSVRSHSHSPVMPIVSKFPKCNRVLLASVILFLVAQAPAVATRIAEIASSSPYCTFLLDPLTKARLAPFVSLATMVNYSLNVVAICVASSHFYSSLTSLLKCFPFHTEDVQV